MKFHEAANLFPMDDETIDELSEDIQKNGQKVPIELLDGRILDGRRRYMACRMAGITPRTINVRPDDPIAYVMSLNLHRRHLSTTQRGIVAGKARDLYDAQAKERQSRGQEKGRQSQKGMVENLPPSNGDSGKSRDKAGKALGVSGKTVDYATRVLKNGCEELIAACEQDKISVSHAARISTKPPEEQKKVVENIKGKPNSRIEEEPEQEITPELESRGKGVKLANMAINHLRRIPKNDPLRKRGFQIVTDWIRHNK